MKVKINKVFRCIILIMIFSLCSFKVLAGENYVNDEAKILKSDIVTKVNDNFAKLEKNTGAKVRIYTMKSLEGKNIDDVASKIAKDTSTDKNAVFVVAVKEHKNKFLVGSGLKSNFNTSDLERIVSLPNDSFKKNDFNAGILKVGQAIDEKITTSAVKEGKAVVKTDGNTKTVEPKKSHTGSIIFVILLIVAVVCIVMYIKRKRQKAVDDFARRNNLNDMSDEGRFRSARVSEQNRNNSSYSNSNGFNNGCSQRNTSNNNYYREEPRGNNTTIINNGGSGNNGFVEGMIVNEMLHSHRDHYRDDRHEESRHYSKDSSNSEHNNDDDDKLLSGDWGESGASSDWGSDSGSTSDSGSCDSSSSDW